MLGYSMELILFFFLLNSSVIFKAFSPANCSSMPGGLYFVRSRSKEGEKVHLFCCHADMKPFP